MTTQAQTSTETQNDEQAIRLVVDTWLRASEKGDLTTILGLMDEDVLFLTPGRAPFGKEAFAQGFERLKDVKLECDNDIQEIRVLGEWAWLHNFLRITFTPSSGDSSIRSGHVLSILHKGQDRQWRIARDSNQVMPE